MAEIENDFAKIKIIVAPSEKNEFAVVFKPAGLASAPLKEGEDSALTQALRFFPEIKNVAGKKAVEYGLVHRIDTATSGILLIATTQRFYDDIQVQQKNGQFIKFYRAKIDGNEKNAEKEFSVTSKFRSFGRNGRKVKPVFENSSAADKKKCGKKQYTTKIKIKGGCAECVICEGFRHQVRSHLAFCGFPIVGDTLYNPKYENSSGEKEFEFEAFKIEFFNPLENKRISVEMDAREGT